MAGTSPAKTMVQAAKRISHVALAGPGGGEDDDKNTESERAAELW